MRKNRFNYVEKEEYFKTKIYSTDILVWKKYLEAVGIGQYKFFNNLDNPIWVSDNTLGICVTESGVEEGKFIVCMFSQDSWVDKYCKDITSQFVYKEE